MSEGPTEDLQQARDELEERMYWARHDGTPLSERKKLEREWNDVRRREAEAKGQTWTYKYDRRDDFVVSEERRTNRDGETYRVVTARGRLSDPATTISWRRDTRIGKRREDAVRDRISARTGDDAGHLIKAEFGADPEGVNAGGVDRAGNDPRTGQPAVRLNYGLQNRPMNQGEGWMNVEAGVAAALARGVNSPYFIVVTAHYKDDRFSGHREYVRTMDVVDRNGRPLEVLVWQKVREEDQVEGEPKRVRKRVRIEDYTAGNFSTETQRQGNAERAREASGAKPTNGDRRGVESQDAKSVHHHREERSTAPTSERTRDAARAESSTPAESGLMYLAHDAQIECEHQGQWVGAPFPGLSLDGTPVITDAALRAGIIIGCTQIKVNEGELPCLLVTQITKGISEVLEIGGQKALLESLQAKTSGIPGNSLKVRIKTKLMDEGEGRGDTESDAAIEGNRRHRRDDRDNSDDAKTITPNQLMWNVRLESGHGVNDPDTVELVSPDGRIRSGSLEGGSFQIDDLPAGIYRIVQKRLGRARWHPSNVRSGEITTLEVECHGFPDRTPVVFRVFEQFAVRPIAELTAIVISSRARTTWRHVQQLGDPPCGPYLFEARIGSKRARSAILSVEPFSEESVQWVQQRLKQLSYYRGQIDGRQSSMLKRAIQCFLADHGFSTPEGEISQMLRSCLKAALSI